MSGFVRLARRVRRRVRRLRDILRQPRASLAPWVHPLGSPGAATFAARGANPLAEPSGRLDAAPDVRWGDGLLVHIGPQGRVEIGAGVVIGHHVTIAADALVRIGARSRVGAHVIVTDTWTYGRTTTVDGLPAPVPEPVEIGEAARLGERVVVGPGATIAPQQHLAPGVYVPGAPVEGGP